MKPVTINGIRISRLIISTRVPGSIEIIFFSGGDLSALVFLFWELLMTWLPGDFTFTLLEERTPLVEVGLVFSGRVNPV
jgi:hypothetical protein